MEITIISDTHGKHSELTDDLIGGDVLIHCGDSMTSGYLEQQLIDFCEWFDKLDLYTHKIFIAGNHCRLFENNPERALEIISSYKNITYLQDSGIKIGRTLFYGTPWQPEFYNWAFNLPRYGEGLSKKWENIPDETDILITHCPPFGYLDSVGARGGLGCELLRERVDSFKNLINCFGHIHYSYGVIQKNSNTFINASNLNENYDYENKPVNLRYNSKNKIATPVKDLRGVHYCEANKSIIFKEYFIDNNTIQNIAKKYKIRIDCLRKVIRNNWKIKGNSESKQKYNIDLTTFEKIDSNWKSYFLGWMYSDGNIYRGAGKNKSLTKTYPKLETRLNSHFIRGYFEGNGCIKVNRVDPNRKIEIVSGSSVFLESLSKILCEEIGVCSKVKNLNTNLWSISFSKKEEVLKFYNYIYTDCEISLNRKRDKFII